MLNIGKLLNYFHIGRQMSVAAVGDLSSFFYVRVYLIIVAAINFISWLSAYIVNKKISSDLVVLHYNIDFGANLIGSVKEIYIIPFLGTLIILINVVLLLFIHRQSRFLAHALLAGALFANIFFLLALASVYMVNFI